MTLVCGRGSGAGILTTTAGFLAPREKGLEGACILYRASAPMEAAPSPQSPLAASIFDEWDDRRAGTPLRRLWLFTQILLQQPNALLKPVQREQALCLSCGTAPGPP